MKKNVLFNFFVAKLLRYLSHGFIELNFIKRQKLRLNTQIS